MSWIPTLLYWGSIVFAVGWPVANSDGWNIPATGGILLIGGLSTVLLANSFGEAGIQQLIIGFVSLMVYLVVVFFFTLSVFGNLTERILK